MATKKCTKCDRYLDITEFYLCYRKRPEKGRLAKCRACVADYHKQNSNRTKSGYLVNRYGITLEQYNQRLSSQGGKCAMCLSDKPGGIGQFHVDHDHQTGMVRGLLCQSCNMGLGQLGDNPLAAANMLARYSVLVNANQ